MNINRKIEYIKNRIDFCEKTGRHKKIKKLLEKKLNNFYKNNLKNVANIY